jgi:hypothetical protein
MLVCWGNDKVHVNHLSLYFIGGSSHVHAPVGEEGFFLKMLDMTEKRTRFGWGK